jgi:histidyl-tRNA synthetase
MVKDKKTKPSKELPLGFVDRQEKELLIRDFVISNIKEVMIKCGFQYLETPSFEYTDSIGKFLPDKERPDQGVFSFKDEKKWLSLRYDLTAPLARYVAKNYLEIPKPFKRYQLGTVWRNEKPGPGRFREFLQFDADFVGTENLMADAELCVMISEILKKCGLTDKDFTIKFSSRKAVEWVLDNYKINSKDKRSKVLRSLDKVDRLGWSEVKKLLGYGRKDASGDFTDGADLTEDQINGIRWWLKYDSKEAYPPGTETAKYGSEETYKEIQKFRDNLDFFGLKNYKFDPTVIRGLEYYTGIVFEVNLNFDVQNFKGKTIQFGSVGGGGRYDNLVSNFGNFDCPATGISIGLDRLVFALMQKKDFKIKTVRPIVICVFNKNKNEEYIGILNKLRASNISSEIYPGEGKLKKQMEYANKIGSPAVILYGDNEIKSGKATLKNLKTGNESSVKIEDLANEIKKLL